MKNEKRKSGPTRAGERDSRAPRSRPRAGPHERLLETAAELFYRQGYSVTGINQIIAESGTHKASFYRYFETKEDLALAYLQMRGDFFREFLARLIKRSASVADFAESWVGLTLREIRQHRFYGCPLANFRGQVPEPDARQAALLKSIVEGWLALIADFVRATPEYSAMHPGRPGADSTPGHSAGPRVESPETIAVRFLKIYEGSAQLYRLTGEASYLRSMKDELTAVLRRPASTQRA